MSAEAASAIDPAALAARPAIGPGFRLQYEPAQGCHVLLYPEGLVRLNGSAGEILKHCDGQRPVADIVTLLEAEFDAGGLAGDVLAFLDIARRQRWVVDAAA